VDATNPLDDSAMWLKAARDDRQAALSQWKAERAKREAAESRATAAEAQVARMREALDCALCTMRHAQVFIRSREKMHPDGQTLYAADIARIESCLADAPKA
jgi:hypothetical protein